ncbi:uncharacterized protein LOC106804532 [Setaria italica]|uniref:uncharacterized protein LOC106804532 n=1 Tax=Setaria italica TaxID=4555 RepID=UPI0003508C1C|nr:uncharacterized protein LOC106804532 [Setaria italica]
MNGDDDAGPYGAGCRAFTADLRRVDWPNKFQPKILEKYDGTIDLEEFLQIYMTSIQAVGGGGAKVMANNFHVTLRGSARSWLMNLPAGSVHSWADLSEQFVANFAGSITRPSMESDLHTVHQRDDKTLRQYIQRFNQVRNTIPLIPPTSVILTFKQGLPDQRLRGKLGIHIIETVAKLFALDDKYAREAEAQALPPPRETTAQQEEKHPRPGKGQGKKEQEKSCCRAGSGGP